MFEQPNSPYDTYHRSIDPDRDPDRDRDLTSAAKYMTRVQLIDQGTFGCIYKPEIDCNTGSMGDSIYVSKIQRKTKTIQNELHIGDLVKQIPNYMFMFSPILKTCPVEFSILQKYDATSNEKCRVLSKTNASASATSGISDTQFISSKIRYVGIYIVDYLNNLPQEICGQKIITSYYLLSLYLGKLWNHGIIHNDIKENNILYDAYNHSPNIIDFGISFTTQSLSDSTKLPFIFYTDKFYPYWCIHHYVLCQICNNKIAVDSPVSEDVFAKIYNDFIIQLDSFLRESMISLFMVANDLEMHKQGYFQFMRSFINKSWINDVQPALLGTHRSWDKYSLSITYLSMISKIDPQLSFVPDPFVQHLKSNVFNV